jgi:hypothetical protein
VMMGFPNYVFDHICQLGNFLHASSELPQWVMMDLWEAYWQSNYDEHAFQILHIIAR